MISERPGFWAGYWRGLVCGVIVGGMAFCSTARASGLGKAFAVATSSDGSTVTLHDGAGVCVGEARAAVWASADRAKTVPGCWIAVGAVVLVSFLDGERGNIPVAQFRRPEGS